MERIKGRGRNKADVLRGHLGVIIEVKRNKKKKKKNDS